MRGAGALARAWTRTGRASLVARRGLADDAAATTTAPKPAATTSSGVTVSPPRPRAPLRQRAAWFTAGLGLTLGLGMYQVGQDASDAVLALERELAKLRDETVQTQSVLRSRIAKLEGELGKRALGEKQA